MTWHERRVAVPTRLPLATALVLLAPGPSRCAQGIDPLTRGSVVLVGERAIDLPQLGGTLEWVPDGFKGKPCVKVGVQQRGGLLRQPVVLTPASRARWWWKKDGGGLCLIQFGLTNPATAEHRWLGYAAGAWAEEPSYDPTVEMFVSSKPPREWTQVERPILEDARKLLRWREAVLTDLALSPWDEGAGWFAQVEVTEVMSQEEQKRATREEAEALSRLTRGPYAPPRIRQPGEREVEFQYSFEECAPGRNSHTNEWGAFGAFEGPFNTLGTRLRVRYPLCDLVFRLFDGQREVEPRGLESFRLGLVDNFLPAVWASFEYEGLRYRVTAYCVPDPDGAFDLFKLEITNPGKEGQTSLLAACVDGPPDLRLEGEVVRGLGTAPLFVADGPTTTELFLRDFGLCDRRAKGYPMGAAPGGAEPEFQQIRVALGGAPVVYRARVQAGRRCTVFLGSFAGVPEPGTWVHRLSVEGAVEQVFDHCSLAGQDRPLCLRFDGAHDADGDGYIEMRCVPEPGAKDQRAFLNVIWVFPEGAGNLDTNEVLRGHCNDRALYRINVGATPEVGWQNQEYDLSDVGIAQLRLRYAEQVQPGGTIIRWIKLPPIHRRQLAAMSYAHHAFSQVLPGEAVPAYSDDRLMHLRGIDPPRAETRVKEYWREFAARCASVETPIPILNDMFRSRLACRAIHQIRLNENVVYNCCSPWNYCDFAYRDHAYQVYAFDLGGRDDLAAQLLQSYCMERKDVPDGPIGFGGRPITLGMFENGLWYHRPGQWDSQGQGLWALVEHYKLTGDRRWLKQTAYPYIRRAAEWIVQSRERNNKTFPDSTDPRHGLLEPGAMEVAEMRDGMHLYYLSAWAVLGLREAADAARALGEIGDAKRFEKEWADLRACLQRSFERTFVREGMYRGHLNFTAAVAQEGMAGYWAHTPLLWPCGVFDPHDPMLTATLRHIESNASRYGSGLLSEGPGSFWPYISVDWAIGYILRGEPDKAVDLFCAYVDNAGTTLSWGEGYASESNLAGGDQPHGWADAQFVNLLRHMLVMEQGDVLHLLPAVPRSWLKGPNPIRLQRLPTCFGALSLVVQPHPREGKLSATLQLDPLGDQRLPRKLILHLRLPDGLRISAATVNGKATEAYTDETLIVPRPRRESAMLVVERAAGK